MTIVSGVAMPRTQKKTDVTARVRYAINKFLGNDCPPGPHCVPWYYIINFQKGGTLPFCLALMYTYDNWGYAACCYTAVHGAYGIVWLFKHYCFPDASWKQRVTILSIFNSFLLVLGPYWLAPFMLISRSGIKADPSPMRCCAALLISIIGMAIMVAADAQKFFTLKFKKGLITDGVHALCRHPNYLGEMMIYGGFAMMVPHWAPWAVLAWVWIQLFHTNICLKEASMSRYEEWDTYASCTGMLLPWLPGLLEGGGKGHAN
jgi:steroid 5-alpha reductase family enzyme